MSHEYGYSRIGDEKFRLKIDIAVFIFPPLDGPISFDVKGCFGLWQSEAAQIYDEVLNAIKQW